jgi:hypothetical protein
VSVVSLSDPKYEASALMSFDQEEVLILEHICCRVRERRVVISVKPHVT